MWKLTLVIAMLILGASPGLATMPIPKALIEGEAALAGRSPESAFNAVRTTTDSAEAESLRDAAIALVCQHISNDDPKIRGIVLATLPKFVETVDLSGIALCTTDSPMDDTQYQFIAQTLDRSRLFFREEDDKRRILRDCMRDGTTELWMGTILPASACMGTATWDGIPDLEADIRNADSTIVGQTSREWLMTVHAFLQGPGSGWDQREDAARRIITQGDATLGNRLKEDESFRTMVLTLLRLHCTRGKKTMCDDLRSGITSAVRSVIDQHAATHAQEIHWWNCATYEKGRFTTMEASYILASAQPDEITDEMIEAAINRPFCDSWRPNHYPTNDEDSQPN